MANMSTTTFNPNYAIPPGAILEEWLTDHGMTQTALAERMDRPIKTINEIIKGKTAITQETAQQLESVTGIETTYWTNAERIYRERAARLEEEERLTSWAPWAQLFPLAEMTKLGWVTAVQDPAAKVRSLLRYFGVASPEAWENVYGSQQVAYRKSEAFRSAPAHLSAWLRQGDIFAQRTECPAYSEDAFRTALLQIRKETAAPIAQAHQTLINQCLQAGVVIVFVPELSKTHVSGATRWVTSSKALIQLSLRYKTDDHLWFTFFHEAAHILLHGKKDVFIEFNHATTPKEQEADQWAADFLIPQKQWRDLIAGASLKCPELEAFARNLQIAPSIVVGRLQHERRIPYVACNYLKRKLRLVASGS